VALIAYATDTRVLAHWLLRFDLKSRIVGGQLQKIKMALFYFAPRKYGN
jgi:hypothetical protein